MTHGRNSSALVDPALLVKIADGMLSGTIPIDSWPDLTMYGPSGLALIEVKRKDKLMFHKRAPFTVFGRL